MKKFIFVFALCSMPLTVHASQKVLDMKPAENGEAPEGFWLTTELLSVVFKKGCLSTVLCNKPFFKLIHTMTLNGENRDMSWPLVQEQQTRSFVTYWTQGDPIDVSLSCQITGTDPSFGFTRICDESSSRRIFNEAAIQRALTKSGSLDVEEQLSMARNVLNAASDSNVGVDKVAIELRGRCFNATVSVRKHVKRCPWCPDPNVQITVVGGSNSAQISEPSDMQRASDALFLHNCIILALCGAVVFAFSGLCCLLVFHCHYRIRNPGPNSKAKRVGSVQPRQCGQNKKKRTTLLKIIGPPQQKPTTFSPNSANTTLQKYQRQCSPDEKQNLRHDYEIPWDSYPMLCNGTTMPMVFKTDEFDNCIVNPPQSGCLAEQHFHFGTLANSNFPQSQNHYHHNLNEKRSHGEFVAEGVCFENRVAPSCRYPIPPPPPMPFPCYNDSMMSPHQEKTNISSTSRNDDSGLESI